MRLKQVASLFMAMTMATGVLTGCGGGSNTETAAAKKADAVTTAGGAGVETEAVQTSMYEVTEPTTIEYWYNGSDTTEYYDALAERFNASQDMVTVVPVSVLDYGTINEKITAAQAAGTGLPGVCLASIDGFANYLNSEVPEPLDPYFEAFDVDTSDFIDAFKEAGSYNGMLYGVPHGISVAAFYYNKDRLAEVGLDKFPETWDEFKVWVKEVTEKTGKTAYTCAAMQNNILYNFMTNWGGELIKEDGTCGFDNETLKQYIREMKELVDAGYVEWSLEGVGSVTNKFMAQDIMCMNISCTTYSKCQNLDFEVGLGWNYTGEKGISSTSGSCMFIPAEQDQMHKNAAFQFIKFLSSAEENFEWAKYSSYLVTHKSVVADDTKMEEIYQALPEMKKIYGNTENYIRKVQSPYYNKAMKPFMEAISQIILENADFESTWSSMIENVNYILAGN